MASAKSAAVFNIVMGQRGIMKKFNRSSCMQGFSMAPPKAAQVEIQIAGRIPLLPR
jgi:hypothetical protein